MIIYYAMGGGLGHLTRARAFLHTVAAAETAAIITASPYASDPRVMGDVPVLTVPLSIAADPPTYRAWLTATLARYEPSTVYLDAFPAGIVGEWCDLPIPKGTEIRHVARLLRWSEYASQLRGVLPPISHTYLLEPLAEAHDEWLRDHCTTFEQVTLNDPPHSDSEELRLRDLLEAERRPIWLVVHSGPPSETLQLLQYADEQSALEGVDPRTIVISPWSGTQLGDDIEQFSVYPAAPLFTIAHRVFTAAGFNAMRQARPIAERHRFVPFERRLDDQFQRAAHRRAQLADAV